MAARLQQIEREKRTAGNEAKKATKAAIQQSVLNSRFRNMNYNNLVMQLRKLCNHPYLVLEDVQSIPDALYFRDLLASSGKLVVLDQLLDALLVDEACEQHKILIFSQMTTMLNILQGFLYTKGLACYRLDGTTDRHTRDHIISQFFDPTPETEGGGVERQPGGTRPHSPSLTPHSQADLEEGRGSSGVRVFLLSTRAGEASTDYFLVPFLIPAPPTSHTYATHYP